jgi:hypothetical protein
MGTRAKKVDDRMNPRAYTDILIAFYNKLCPIVSDTVCALIPKHFSWTTINPSINPFNVDDTVPKKETPI